MIVSSEMEPHRYEKAGNTIERSHAAPEETLCSLSCSGCGEPMPHAERHVAIALYCCVPPLQRKLPSFLRPARGFDAGLPAHSFSVAAACGALYRPQANAVFAALWHGHLHERTAGIGFRSALCHAARRRRAAGDWF